MDWTKAKSIIIVALILTNLVLIFAYTFDGNIFEGNNEKIQSDTIKLLESKNIFVDTEIPEKHYKMQVLSVEYDKIDQEIVEAQIAAQEPKKISKWTDAQIDKMTTEFLDKCGMLTENVRLDEIKRSDGKITVTYKNYINDIEIDDNYIICTLMDGKVSDVQRYWLNPVESDKMKKKDIIPAAAALIKFMSENQEGEKINIQDISLVYWLDQDSFNTESPVADTAFPAWRISYNDGKIKHIRGF